MININPKKRDILIKFFGNNCSEKELEQLSHWMNDEEEHAELLALIDDLWHQSETIPEYIKIDSDQMFNKIQHKIGQLESEKHVRSFLFVEKNLWRKIARVAAVFLLPALLLTAGYYYKVNHQSALALNTVTVPNGQKKMVVLPDGTKVWINSGSSLNYPKTFKGDTREVQLSGEAFFDVTHDKKHPFIVRTHEVNIKVLGTVFDVSAYPGDLNIRTTLIRGRVVAYLNSAKETLASRVFLFPGQQAVYSTVEQKFSVTQVNTKLTGSWKLGKLIFNDAPLTEVVKKLNRWYNVNIQIQDTAIESYLYSVDFNNQPLKTVEEILSAITPVQFVKADSLIIVKKDQKRLNRFMNKNNRHK